MIYSRSRSIRCLEVGPPVLVYDSLYDARAFLFRQVPQAKELFAKASDILGYDLLDKCKNGPKNLLDSTVRFSPREME